MTEDLSRQVEGELSSLFSAPLKLGFGDGEPRIFRYHSPRPPLPPVPRATRWDSKSALAATAVAGVLAGFGLAFLIDAGDAGGLPPKAEQPSPAARPGLQVLVTAPKPSGDGAPRSATAAAPVMAVAAVPLTRSQVAPRPPQVAGPQPQDDALAIPARRAEPPPLGLVETPSPLPVPSPRPERHAAIAQAAAPAPALNMARDCASPGCLDVELAQADQQLAAAVHEAWRLGLPNRELHAQDRVWAAERRAAAASSDVALLHAYRSQIAEAQALVDELGADND